MSKGGTGNGAMQGISKAQPLFGPRPSADMMGSSVAGNTSPTYGGGKMAGQNFNPQNLQGLLESLMQSRPQGFLDGLMQQRRKDQQAVTQPAQNITANTNPTRYYGE